MSRVPTMMIETENGPVVINRSAFDPETMREHGAAPEEPKAPEAQQMLVTKKGKKFLVVDDKAKPIERDGIDASGYATEADAWTAIMALQG